MAGLKQLIILEQFTTTQDADGNNEEAVTATHKQWAEVSRIGGGRTTKHGVTVLGNSIEFTTRFKYDFTPTGNWRITYDGQRHTVRSITKQRERKFYWSIIADA